MKHPGQYHNRINVVLHGLFVVHIKDDHIELLTPYVHDHVYYAGRWVKDIGDLECRSELQQGQVYELVGVDSFMRPPSITYTNNTVISKSIHGCEVRSSLSYCKISLPFPLDLLPIRSMAAPVVYRGKDSDKVHVNGVSLCQVLIFPVSTFENVRLWGTDWSPKDLDYTDKEVKVANLHLWAEPKVLNMANHGHHAYQQLMNLLPPLDLDPVVEKGPCPPGDTGIPGLPREQLFGLAELKENNCPEGKYVILGSRVTNCQSVTVIS
jgi:hypothetical protein